MKAREFLLNLPMGSAVMTLQNNKVVNVDFLDETDNSKQKKAKLAGREVTVAFSPVSDAEDQMRIMPRADYFLMRRENITQRCNNVISSISSNSDVVKNLLAEPEFKVWDYKRKVKVKIGAKDQGLRTSDKLGSVSQNTRSKDWNKLPPSGCTRSKRPRLCDGNQQEHGFKYGKITTKKLVRKPCAKDIKDEKVPFKSQDGPHATRPLKCHLADRALEAFVCNDVKKKIESVKAVVDAFISIDFFKKKIESREFVVDCSPIVDADNSSLNAHLEDELREAFKQVFTNEILIEITKGDASEERLVELCLDFETRTARVFSKYHDKFNESVVSSLIKSHGLCEQLVKTLRALKNYDVALSTPRQEITGGMDFFRKNQGVKGFSMPSEEFRLVREQWPIQKAIDQSVDQLKNYNVKVSESLKEVDGKIDTVQKLLFELVGYKKLLPEEIKDACGGSWPPDEESSKIPENMVDDILKIDGVYGTGTIYGKAVVHLEPTTVARRSEIINGLKRVVADHGREKLILVKGVAAKPAK